MSNQYLKLRRSAVPGKVPTTSSLDFGEIALNTYDGLLFIKKSGSLGEQVISIGATTATASFAISSSYSLTASYALNAGASTAVTNQITSGSVTASVNIGYDGIFLIKSGSVNFLEISGSGESTLQSTIFIVKNLVTQQPVLTVSESVVSIATHSFDPTSPTNAGALWFTANDLYVGLE